MGRAARVICLLLLGLSLASACASDTKRVYFIPLGKVPALSLDQLARDYQEKLQLKIELLKEVPLDSRAVDFWRRQLVAEELIRLMKRHYPREAKNPKAVLIGVTAGDMFIREYSWQFAFAFRQEGRFVVVSTARMDPVNLHEDPDPALLYTRARKMISKNLGLLYYGLPESKDPRSVLYGPVLGVDDLDKIGENF